MLFVCLAELLLFGTAIYVRGHCIDILLRSIDNNVNFDSRMLRLPFSVGFLPSVLRQIHSVARYLSCAAAVSILVLCSLFLVIKMSSVSALFSTHSFQYTWSITAVYLLVVLMSLVLCVHGSIVYTMLGAKKIEMSYQRVTSAYFVGMDGKQWLMQRMKIFMVVATYCVVITFVNVIYVLVLLQGLSAVDLICLQLLLSVFKLSCNRYYIDFGIRRLVVSSASRNVCVTFMMLFSFLVGQVLATLFNDDSCLHLLVTGMHEIEFGSRKRWSKKWRQRNDRRFKYGRK